ncbi:MAG: leucine-rich repeat domain-containing protein, partial [Clostridia bacterium]|nr:leucine-rich repeat domain-containing protein [Clostridia bacterium]
AAVTVGETTHYSNVSKYSILRYAYTVQNDPDAEPTLLTMLTDMLDYGASAQKHFDYKADRPANGEWYDIQVVNGTHADGFPYGLCMQDDEVTLTADSTLGGKAFSHWKNSAGTGVGTETTLTVFVDGKRETYTAVYGDEDEVVYSQGLKFTLNADEQSYSVTDIGTCTDTDIIIPATYEGLPVSGISFRAFCLSKLTSVAIPDSVKDIATFAFQDSSALKSVSFGNNSQLVNIGEGAFAGTSLTSIEIPASVKSIGKNAFSVSDSLESIVVAFENVVYKSSENCLIETETKTLILGCKNSSIPTDGSVTSIGVSAFGGCTGLTSIDIPDSVTSIGSYAFQQCTSLANITIGDDVASIGDNAFYNCTSLTSIKIPKSVTSIGTGVFSGCRGVESVVVDTDNTVYHSTGNCIIETDTKTLIFGCKNSVIPLLDGSVTSIGSLAFADCTGLTNINIPDSVTSIGNNAFEHCTSLTNIEIPDGVASIGTYAFTGCTSLTSVTFGEDSQLTSLGDSAFSDCTSLISVIIPGNVTSIGASTFSGCTSLTSIKIPDSVTSIDYYAFLGCESLASIEIPNSVTNISPDAFVECWNLLSVYYGGSMADWNSTLGDEGKGDLDNATRYYYSETKPTEEGNYWHYVDGVPTVW